MENIVLNKDIEENDIIKTFERYKNLTNNNQKKYTNEYYNRKENIGSYIYDHLFLKLENKINNNIIIWFKKALNQCHFNYNKKLSINKPKISLSSRDFNITNFYNTIYYEVYITKLLNEIKNVFIKNNILSENLIDLKFFWYAHNIDFKNNDFNIKHYLDWWKKFEENKRELLKNNNYFIEFDITNFYNNINHNIFINLLELFFNKYSNFKWIDNFLNLFQDSLFKANWYKNIWLPQWLLWSDILSTLFLWLIFIENKNLLDITFKNNIRNSWSIKFIFFADDFFIVWNKKENLEKFIHNFKKFFNNNWLSIHWYSKWIEIKSKNQKEEIEINFDLVKENNIEEIKKLFKLFLEELQKDLNLINISILKKLFRWIYKINTFEKIEKEDFFKKICTECIYNINDINKIKKLFILQSISVKSFSFLLKNILENNLVKISLLINIYNKYLYLLENWTLEILYLDNEFKNKYINNFLSELKDNLKEKKQLFFSNLENKLLLKKELKKQWLVELEKLLYSDEKINSFEENSLSLKMNYLFETNKESLNKFSNFLYNLFKENKNLFNELNKFSYDLINITDNMILIKSNKEFLYLNDQWFIADLYSLFNILLSILFSLLYKKKKEVNILWWEDKNIWKIQLNWTEFFLEKIDSDLKNLWYLLFYVTKLRAELNHKEKNTEWNKNVNIFNKFDNKEHFYYSIQNWINLIFNKIEKYIT